MKKAKYQGEYELRSDPNSLQPAQYDLHFTKNKIKAIETEIEALANQLLDQISSGRTDILENYARKIPVIVIARMLGVPESMCDQLLIWSNNMVGMYQANRTKDIEAKAVESALDFSKYLKTLILEKRKFPSKDIISNLLINSEFQESLSDKEIITTSILLLNAGHEATTHTIGNSIKTILELEIPFSHLKNQPVLAIEELLRFDPPLHLFTRYALNDCLIQDYKFTEGSKVGLLLAAANRDPKVFTKASRALLPALIRAVFATVILFCSARMWHLCLSRKASPSHFVRMEACRHQFPRRT